MQESKGIKQGSECVRKDLVMGPNKESSHLRTPPLLQGCTQAGPKVKAPVLEVQLLWLMEETLSSSLYVSALSVEGLLCWGTRQVLGHKHFRGEVLRTFDFLWLLLLERLFTFYQVALNRFQKIMLCALKK